MGGPKYNMCSYYAIQETFQMKCSIGGCNNKGGKVINPKNLDGPLVSLCLQHCIEGFNEYMREHYRMEKPK
jgi:hypothetical protein